MTDPLPDIADAVFVLAVASATHPPGTRLDAAGDPLPDPADSED